MRMQHRWRCVCVAALSTAMLTADVQAQPTSFRLSAQPVLAIGSEDKGTAYQLDRVHGALRLADGTIIVGNSATNELRFYDAKGQYLRSAGRKGGGPGEFGDYVSVRPSMLGSSSIIAPDDAGARINRYDLSGKTLGQIRLLSTPAATQSSVVATTGAAIIGKVTANARLQGAPGERIKTVYRYGVYDSIGVQRVLLFDAPTKERMVHEWQGVIRYSYIPFASEPVVAASPRSLYTIRNGEPEIEYWSLTGQLIGTLKWPAARTRVKDIWTRWRQAELDDMTRQNDKLRYADFFSDKLPMPEYVPVAEALFVDGGGRLWVQRTRQRWDPKTTFDVLEANGKYLGQVTMPPKFTVFQIGTDWVLGRARDENDVEQVQLYRLTR